MGDVSSVLFGKGVFLFRNLAIRVFPDYSAFHFLPCSAASTDAKDKTMKNKEEATELEYLKWFRINADFGPADGDVQYLMNQRFEKETGKLLPKGWRNEDEE